MNISTHICGSNLYVYLYKIISIIIVPVMKNGVKEHKKGADNMLSAPEKQKL